MPKREPTKVRISPNATSTECNQHHGANQLDFAVKMFHSQLVVSNKNRKFAVINDSSGYRYYITWSSGSLLLNKR